MRAWVVVAAIVGAVMVTVLTYPTVTKMGSVGRFDTGDGRFSIWNVGWVSRALITDPRHLLDANIFFPHTGTLSYSELNLVAGVFGVPAYAVSHNPVAATNSAIVIALWLSFMCMWAFVRRLTGSPLAGLVSATAYTFCPYLLAHTAHIQLQMAFVVPLTFLALHRLIDLPTVWRGVQLGLAVATSGLACGYYGIYGGIALGVAAIWFASSDRAYWKGLAVALVTAAVLVGPIMFAYHRARADVGGGRVITSEDLRHYAAQPIDYLSSGAKAHELWQPAKFSGREPLFLGVTASILALFTLVAAARGRRLTVAPWTVAGYAVVGAFAALASFGPSGMLYTLLFKTVPAMGLVRVPARFGLVTMFAVAALAGVAVSTIRLRRWLALVFLVMVAAECGAQTEEWGWPSWPVRAMSPVPHAYRVLATLPRGATVEYPFPYTSENTHNHTKAMLMSAYHWQPMVNGYSDIVPDDFYTIMLPINAFPDAESFAIMKQYKVRYVVWRMNTYDAESRARLDARFPPFMRYLKPIVQDEDVWLFEIVDYP